MTMKLGLVIAFPVMVMLEGEGQFDLAEFHDELNAREREMRLIHDSITQSLTDFEGSISWGNPSIRIAHNSTKTEIRMAREYLQRKRGPLKRKETN